MAEDWAHLGTLITLIRKQRDIADDVHAVTACLIRTPGKPHDLLQRLSSEVRQLSGLFHSLDLLVASLGDPDSRFPQGYNLYHFAACEHTLVTLQHFLQVRGSAGGPSETNLRQDLEGFIKHLNRHRIKLEYASQATSVASLLAAVTQRSSSESRAGRGYRDRRWFSKIDPASQQYLEDRVFSAFRSVEPTTHLCYHLSLMCPGTYNWIQDEAFFTAWKDGTKPKLLISGPPGVGKTTLASSIIQRLSHEPDSDAICFSFVGEETPKPTVASIIGALISHIAMSNRTAFDSLETHFRMVVSDQKLSYLGTDPMSLNDLFKSLIHPLRKVFIVVDGLKDVLADISLLIELVASWTVDHSGVQTLLISHSSPIVISLCEETRFAAVDFEPRPVDIDEFIKYRLAQVPGGSSVGSQVAHSIHSALSERPQSFHYVECQLDHLLSLPSDKAQQIELADLPKMLGESYMRTFQQTSKTMQLGLAWI